MSTVAAAFPLRHDAGVRRRRPSGRHFAVSATLAVAASLVPAPLAHAEAAGNAFVLDIYEAGNRATIVADAASGWTVTPTLVGGGVELRAGKTGESLLAVVVQPPEGTSFAPGQYATTTAAAPTATAARTAASRPSCGVVSGVLDVASAEYADGELASFAASFTYSCGSTADVHGEIRYQSALGYRAARAGGDTRFGQVAVGAELTRTLTVSSVGSLPVAVEAATLSGSPAFTVARDGCGGLTIGPGGSCEVEVRFTAAAGSAAAALRVPVETARGELVAALSGTGVEPPSTPREFTVSPGSDGIALEWSAFGIGTVSEIRVLRDGQPYGTAAPHSGVFYDRPLPLGARHTYALVAWSPYGQSAPTKSLTASTPTELPAAGSRRVVAVEFGGTGPDVPADERAAGSEITLSRHYLGPGHFGLSYHNGLLILGAPPDAPWVPGEYPVSTGSSREPGSASVNVLWCHGPVTGTLTVHEASVRADGTPDVFAATYVGSCSNASSVRAEVRWNSDRAFDALHLNVNTLWWGSTTVGSTYPVIDVDVTNVGTAARPFATPTVTGAAAADWTVTPKNCPAALAPLGGSCVVTIANRPTAPGERLAQLLIGGRTVPLRTLAFAPPGRPVVRVYSTVGRNHVTWDPVDPGGAHDIEYWVFRNGETVDTAIRDRTHYDDPRIVPPGTRTTYEVVAIGFGVGWGPRSVPVTVVQPDRQFVLVEQTPAGGVLAVRPAHDPTARVQEIQAGTQGLPAGAVVEPAVSADGSRIVFVNRTATGHHLWLVRSDDVRAPARLTSGAVEDGQPAFSPDGTALAFTRETATSVGIFTRSLVGDGATRPVPGAGGASSPTFLPSGRELVVVRHAATPYVEILAADGSSRRKVVGTDGAIQAAVSPDGTRVAFVHWSGSGLRTTIRVVPVGGGTPLTVASLGGFAQNPTWTPDGGLLHFDSAPVTDAEELGNADLYAVRPAGGGLANLTRTPLRDESHPVLNLMRPPPRPSQPRLAADFTGDGRAEPAVFRQSDGTWFVRGVPTVRWGQRGDVPVPGDYNGDRRADRAVFRPSNGAWYVHGVGTFSYGQPGDVPAPADYNGDGRMDIAVFRPSTGTWHVRNGRTAIYGQTGDVPVPADYTGDRRAEFAVYRPSTGQWFTGGAGTYTYGRIGAVPAPADYTGDGRADVAVYDPYARGWAIAGLPFFGYGSFADVPVPGDFNGDRKADLTVFRPSTGTWHVRAIANVAYGLRGDEPV